MPSAVKMKADLTPAELRKLAASSKRADLPLPVTQTRPGQHRGPDQGDLPDTSPLRLQARPRHAPS